MASKKQRDELAENLAYLDKLSSYGWPHGIVSPAAAQKFYDHYDKPEACNERARILAGTSIASDEMMRLVHQGIALAIKHTPQDEPPLGSCFWNFMQAVSGSDAPAFLRKLADYWEHVSMEASADFEDIGEKLKAPEGFNPTSADGIKSIMLAAFFKLQRGHRLYPLPTIGELDDCIRNDFKWRGEGDELRKARRKLGLNGLPRRRAGRPKK